MSNRAFRQSCPGLERVSFSIAISFILLCGWLIAGCAVGPNYKRPKIDSPEGFRGETQPGTNSFGDLPWWEVFHDENLTNLIHIALTNNLDLRIAFTRVEQARAMVAQARSELFPQLNYAGVAGYGKIVGANNGLSPSGVGAGSVYGGDVNATWEIDLFGRIRRLTESARAQYFATEEARRDVLISLIAQVAQDYFQLLALDRELAIERDATNSFGQSLKLFTAQLNGGVASRLETSSAQALMEANAAEIPELERQILLQENQLSVLLGMNPNAIFRTNSVLEKQQLPIVPAGLPASLLERRPDIREAEQFLRSANAQVGVAVADFFPQLELTGLLGRVSPEVSALTGGGAAAYSIAAGLTGPLFQGGKLTAQYRQALAARNQYALQYQSTILNALQEVSGDLISREKLAESRDRQARAVTAYEDAVKIANERYRLGQSSYYEVLQEQQLLFPAQTTLVQTELNQLVSMVQLYRALGGGWQQPEKK
jgi:multidrug efflux system outer membrane protein